MYNFQSFSKLLNRFRSTSFDISKTEQTFMQVLGYPHYENVCSNILSFFFNTNESHGFQYLFAHTLLECIRPLNHKKTYHVDNIERECITQKHNRIDIVFETEDMVIGIENKVYHNVNNDLADYATYIKERADKRGKEALCVLLSLRDNIDIVNGTSFANVTYKTFIERLKANMGAYLLTANPKWVTFLFDFVKTLEELQGEVAMDKDLVNFFNKNKSDIDALLAAKASLLKSLKDKVIAIKNLVASGKEWPCNHMIYCPQNMYYAEYYIEFDTPAQIDGQIVFDTYIDTECCYIIAGVRGDTSTQKALLRKYLESNGVSVCEWQNSDVYLQLAVFSVFETETVIADKFCDLLTLILAA